MQLWPLVFLLIFLGACTSQTETLTVARGDWTVMGTTFEVTVYRPESEAAQTNDDLDAAFVRVTDIDQRMSLYKPDSELVALNAQAGTNDIPLSEPLYDVLSASAFYDELTQGAFDITVQPLVDLWGFYRVRDASVPPQREIAKALQIVGMDRLALDSETPLAALESGTSVDLGAIAKGYAVDVIVEDLQQRGVSAALVNLGGMVRVFGQPSGKRLWTIGVRHPRENRLIGEIRLTGGAVATSGDYDRYFEVDGKRYSHIIDPRTGQPAQELPALTVVAPTALAADALSTAAFVLGPDKGMTLLRRCSNVEGLVVNHNSDGSSISDVVATAGLMEDRGLAFEGYAETRVTQSHHKDGRQPGRALNCVWP